VSAGLRRAAVCFLAWVACATSSSLARIQPSDASDTRIATLRVLDDAVRGLGRVDSDYQQVLRNATVTLEDGGRRVAAMWALSLVTGTSVCHWTMRQEESWFSQSSLVCGLTGSNPLGRSDPCCAEIGVS
jgi:hypothetical protein